MIQWETLGLFPERFPVIAGSYRGKQCLVVASGRCVWEDCKEVGETPPVSRGGFDIMCVNDIVMHWPGPVEHFYTNDWKWLSKWSDARRPRYENDYGRPVHSHSCNEGAKYHWPWPGHGTSTLNAVYTALALGYDKIVIAGAPMDNTGHYFDPPWVDTTFAQQVPLKDGKMRYWSRSASTLFDGRVTAVSGRIKDALSEAT